MKKTEKRKAKLDIDCMECKSQAHCCKYGAWIDLEEAKKILLLGIKGDFFHLEIDKDFPSGFCVGTSYEDNSCSFLGKDGLCAVHKVSYEHKPKTCKDFPYENNKVSPLVDVLCTEFKAKVKSKKKAKNK